MAGWRLAAGSRHVRNGRDIAVGTYGIGDAVKATVYCQAGYAARISSAPPVPSIPTLVKRCRYSTIDNSSILSRQRAANKAKH